MEQTESDKIKSEVLTDTMQVLKIVMMGLLRDDPTRAGQLADFFMGQAAQPRLQPVARAMLKELAHGLKTFPGTGVPRG